jgi:hypothetical protein
MTDNFRHDGFSARRKTIRFKEKTIRGGWIFFIAALMLLASCHENSNGQHASAKKKDLVAHDSLNKPKVNIKVNRHYDEKGNMIGFDSTYSSYYSNVRGDTMRMDSMMNSFDLFFNRNHASQFNNQFNRLFFEDSLRYPDFFHNDFFLKRYELNDRYMRDMMHEMDSVKNKFYRDQHLNPKPAEKKKSASKT